MTTQEHLNKILEKCRAFLEITKKRTPGEWKAESSRAYCTDETVTHNVVGPPSDFMYLQEFPDAAFIAACAGLSEAMARSTIAAVTDILEYWDLHKDTELVVAIIAAWPEETL